jgi:hypothetical protein
MTPQKGVARSQKSPQFLRPIFNLIYILSLGELQIPSSALYSKSTSLPITVGDPAHGILPFLFVVFNTLLLPMDEDPNSDSPIQRP